MNCRLLLNGSLVLLAASCGALGAVRVWTGAANNDWYDPANWSPPGAPDPADTLNVPSGSPNLSPPFTLTGQLNWTGDSFSGGLIVGGGGTLHWQGGGVSSLGSLTVAGGGLVDLDGPGSFRYITGALTNRGTIRWLDGGMGLYYLAGDLGNQGGIWNEPGGVIDVQCDQTLSTVGGYAGTLHNAGLLRKSGQSGVTSFSAAIDNTGTNLVQAGTFSFLAGGELGGGVFEAAAGAQIHFDAGNFRATGPVDWRGPGDVAMTGDSLELVNTTGTLLMRGGYILGSSVVQGTLHWQGGGVSSLGSLTVAAGGMLDLDGPGSFRYITGALTNRGTIRWLDGGMGLYYLAGDLGNQGGIWNEPGGVIDVQCDQTISTLGGYAGTLHNAGLLRKSGQSGVTSFSAAIDNTGTNLVQAGTFSFLAGGELGGGVFEAAAGAQIHFDAGNFRATGPVDWRGPGEVAMTGDSLELVNTTGTLLMRGGYILGSSVVQGTLHWQGGGVSSLGSLTVAAGAMLDLDGPGSVRYITGALTNRGTIRWLDGGMGLYYLAGDLGNQGGIWNEPGGVIDVQCDQTISTLGGYAGTLHNAGLLRKSGQSGVTSFSAAIDNTGTNLVQAGTFSFLAGGELGGGVFEAAAGAQIHFDAGNFRATGPVDWRGPGEVAMTGDSLELVNTTGTLLMRGGSILGSSVLKGTLHWQGGGVSSLGSLTVAAGGLVDLDGPGSFRYITGPLTNRGTIRWLDGGMGLYYRAGDSGNQGEIWNEPGGLIDVQCDQTLSTVGGFAGTLHNAGLLRKSGQSGVTSFSAAIDNTGTNLVQAGTFSFLAGGELGGGVFEAAAGAQIHFDAGNFRATGPVDWRGPGEVAMTGDSLEMVNTTGTLLMRGGSILGSSVLKGTLHWQGGGVSSLGSLTVAAGGLVDLDGPGSFRYITGPLTNRGTIRWLDGGMGLYYRAGDSGNQGEIWNEPGGLIDVQCDQTLSTVGGFAGTLHNAGLLRKSGQSGITTLNADVDNAGTIETRMGTFSLQEGFSNAPSGSLTFSLGGTALGTDYGQLQCFSPVAFNGTVAVSTRNGFRPNPGDTFQLLSYPSATGDFSCLSGLDLGGGLMLVPQYARTSLELVTTTYDANATEPRLFIARTPGGVRITWPLGFPDWQLQSSIDLVAPNWMPVSTQCGNQALVPVTLPQQYFQLRSN